MGKGSRWEQWGGRGDVVQGWQGSRVSLPAWVVTPAKAKTKSQCWHWLGRAVPSVPGDGVGG